MKTRYVIPSIACFLAITLTGCGNGGEPAATTSTYPIIHPPPISLHHNSSIPSNTQAVGGANQVIVSWDPAAGAVSYNIYWSTATGVTKTGNVITGVASPYVHTGLTASTTYYYIVVPVFEGGEGFPSAEVSGTTSP